MLFWVLYQVISYFLLEILRDSSLTRYCACSSTICHSLIVILSFFRTYLRTAYSTRHYFHYLFPHDRVPSLVPNTLSSVCPLRLHWDEFGRRMLLTGPPALHLLFCHPLYVMYGVQIEVIPRLVTVTGSRGTVTNLKSVQHVDMDIWVSYQDICHLYRYDELRQFPPPSLLSHGHSLPYNYTLPSLVTLSQFNVKLLLHWKYNTIIICPHHPDPWLVPRHSKVSPTSYISHFYPTIQLFFPNVIWPCLSCQSSTVLFCSLTLTFICIIIIAFLHFSFDPTIQLLFP